ncbi:hypothetical protein BKA63DRAFT_549674 [Paraphoma chrysanthemicola]|nr:hypothetical protein BKA63DRAFT_549674 [Paraphoma chrysanthemicola]
MSSPGRGAGLYFVTWVSFHGIVHGFSSCSNFCLNLFYLQKILYILLHQFPLDHSHIQFPNKNHLHQISPAEMPFSLPSHDPPPDYIEDDPVPDYTEDPTPTPVFESREPAARPAFLRLDSGIEANSLPCPVRAPPRTYIPTHAPSITVTQTQHGPSVTLTDLTRPRHQQTEEEEDFGAPSTSRRRCTMNRACLSGSGCICAFLVLLVILTLIISMVVLSATNWKGDQRVGSHGCEVILHGVCEGVMEWSTSSVLGLGG